MTRTPEERRRSHLRTLIFTGFKLILVGSIFLFALDNNKRLAVAIGIVAELGAVACFVRVYRLTHPQPPRPPKPVEPYAALQQSMQQLRAKESPSPGGLPPRSPLDPR